MTATNRPNICRAADTRARILRDAHPFSHPWNANSRIVMSPLSDVVGMQRACVSMARVPPGKESFLYHLHHREEEWIYILAGRAIAEIDGAEYEVGPGDFMGFPTPSVAHHLRNPFDTDLIYLPGGERLDLEVADFPKLGKRFIRRATGTEVYDLADGRPFGPLD